MMINNYKNWFFFFALYFFTSSNVVGKEFTVITPRPEPSIVTTNNDSKFSHATNRFGIRASGSNYTVDHIDYRYIRFTASDFQQLFRNTSEYDILSNYDLYVFNNFQAFAQTLPLYTDFMLALHNEIKNNVNVRENTACVPEFEYKFGPFTKYKSGFHDFIGEQVQTLCNAKKIETLHKDWLARIATADNHHKKRLRERIEAAQKTAKQNGKLYDYSSKVPTLKVKRDEYKQLFSNTYGTALDCQLHKELCEARTAINQLARQYAHNQHIHTLEALIHTYAAQAKTEQCLIAAFEMSDFCNTMTHILSHGLQVIYDVPRAVGKGIYKGFDTFTSLDHWIGMVTSPLEICTTFFDVYSKSVLEGYGTAHDIDHALASDLFFDTNKMNALEQKFRLQGQAQEKAMRATYKEMSAMSWQQIVENAAELGTTIILDTVALNALSNVGRIKNNPFIKNLVKTTESGAILTEQYAVEVAGLGKLIVEDVTEFTVHTVQTMKSNAPIPKNIPKAAAKLNKPVLPAAPVPTASKGIIRNDLRSKIQQYEKHIFSPDHEAKGLLNLGKDKPTIMDSLNDVIISLDKKGLLKEGPNQIKSTINGISNVEIRCFIQNGEAISVNAYISKSGRIYGNFIDTTRV